MHKQPSGAAGDDCFHTHTHTTHTLHTHYTPHTPTHHTYHTHTTHAPTHHTHTQHTHTTHTDKQSLIKFSKKIFSTLTNRNLMHEEIKSSNVNTCTISTGCFNLLCTILSALCSTTKNIQQLFYLQKA